MGKPQDDIIGIAEASAISGMAITTIRGHAASGDLPAWKVGPNWAFRRGDVLRFKRPKMGRPPKKRKGKS